MGAIDLSIGPGEVIHLASMADLEAAVAARSLELGRRFARGEQRLTPSPRRGAVVSALSDALGDAVAGGFGSWHASAGLDGVDTLADIAAKLRQSSARDHATTKRRRPGVSVADRQRLRRYVAPVMDRAALDIQGRFEEDFRRAADAKLRALAKSGASRGVVEDEIMALARAYGVDRFKGVWARTWYQTYALNSAANAGALLAYTSPGNRNLFPYLEIETRRDDRVRDEHAHLDGFLMPTDWEGVMRFTPPLGWNCRCRLRPVGHAEAARLLKAIGGIRGASVRFPRGLDQIKFRGGRLPGLDRKFRPAVVWPSSLNPFTRAA